MEREPVESTSLRSVGYDPRTHTLEVEFHSGGIYRYLDVPPDMYRTLRQSDSLGRVFARQIRNAYECWKLVRRPGAQG
jgi:hypothetical protein